MSDVASRTGPFSRAPHQPWFERIDPFELPAFSVRWQQPGASVPAMLATGGGPRRANRWERVTTPLPARLSRRSLPLRRVVACLLQWHHLTSQQLGALVGVDRRHCVDYLRPLYLAGIIERGAVRLHDISTSLPYVYRLCRGEELDEWLAALDHDEWLAVNPAGVNATARDATRHDLVAAEIGLRAAEVQDGLQTLYGEAMAAPEKMVGGYPAGIRGDGVIVRRDGLRIVWETTMSSNPAKIFDKMVRWGRILGRGGGVFEDAVVVVFVNTSFSSQRGDASRLRSTLARALGAPALGADGGPADFETVRRARSAVFAADWRQWFPAAGRWARAFFELTVDYSMDGRTWSKVSLAHGDRSRSGLPFPGRPGLDHPRRVRDRIYAVPPWLDGPPARFVGGTAPADRATAGAGPAPRTSDRTVG